MHFGIGASEFLSQLNGNRFCHLRGLTFKSFLDRGAIANLRTYPIPVQTLCCLKCRSTSAEWVQHNISRASRHLDTPRRNQRFQLVDMPTGLEFLVPCGSCVFPKIGQIQPPRVQIFPVTTVVLNVFPAMPARRNGKANLVKIAWSSFGEIKDCVMCWIELVTSRERPFHG